MYTSWHGSGVGRTARVQSASHSSIECVVRMIEQSRCAVQILAITYHPHRPPQQTDTTQANVRHSDLVCVLVGGGEVGEDQTIQL